MNMYAVFEDGSHQYKVEAGALVQVDYREGDKGTRVEFSRVLLHADGGTVQIGQPALEGARVVAEVVDHPSVKTITGKYRRRKNYRRVKGHRQYYTLVKIKHILLKGQSEPVEQKPAEQPVATTTPTTTPTPTPAVEPTTPATPTTPTT
jgi:large subunit ribosomal protein L21